MVQLQFVLDHCYCQLMDRALVQPGVYAQARFWKLRQSELEGYNYLYSPLKMRAGDLSGAGLQHPATSTW
jgi:hypothetical protein